MKKFSIKIENMAKNKPTICLIILLFVGVFIILMGMFISYAYFTANVQGTGKQITISRSKLIVHFNNGDELNETEISPGDTITKTFYVKNDTNSSETYRINWKYLVNNFKHSSNLKYTITSTNSGGTISNVTLPSTGTNIVIINSITIAANTTQTYTMTITYQNASQGNDDYDKNLIGKVLISDTSGNEILPETSTGSYDREITAEKNLFNFTLAEAVDLLYPIGSIYTSTSSENPSVSFPGTTWERYGKGKTLVSLDENDTSFDTVNETGGTKDEVVPYHRHELNGVSAKAGSTNDDNNNGLHTHNITATTTTTGSTHTHTIAANGISVRSTATTTSTAMPDQLTETFENGVDYGEHGHNITGSGTNTSAYTIASSGSHEHTTTAKNDQTTGAGGSHNHSIPSLSVSLPNTDVYTGTEAAHTHGFSVPALSGSTSSTSKTLTGSWYNTTGRFPGTNTVSGIISKVSGSIKHYWAHTGGTAQNTYGFKATLTHDHTLSTTSKSGNTTGAGSSHNHSIPTLSGSTSTGTTGNESSHTHGFDIPALDVASSGAHTHTIPADGLTIGVSGSTVEANHEGWHVHTVTIPSLTSTNNNAITIASSGEHQHTITGSATSAGAHEHTLSGYSGYAGTNESTTNKNLQPYITVYIWKRVS